MTTPSIIFENEDFFIINKPSGLVVHPFDGSNEDTLVGILHEKYPYLKEIQGTTFTLQNGTVVHLGGIVHKLDRETSGIMVIAKNQKTQDTLRELFSSHKIKKVYLALVDGVIQPEAFRINAPLGRNKKDYKQVAFPKNPRGELRDAITDVMTLLRGNDITLVKLSPLTGRTHQLRAHMQHSGHPICGDKAYGSTKEMPRIMLHAQTLSFIVNNQEYTFEAPTPKEFIEPFEN